MGNTYNHNDISSIYKYLTKEEIKEVEDRLMICGNEVHWARRKSEQKKFKAENEYNGLSQTGGEGITFNDYNSISSED